MSAAITFFLCIAFAVAWTFLAMAVGWRLAKNDSAGKYRAAEARRPDEPEAEHPISATQPASPARELTDAELTVIGAEHLEAHAQFVGAGEVWVEGEIEFARAVIARDRALREQG